MADGLNASQKRSARKAIDEATAGKLYDYDRISARTTAVREQAAKYGVTPADIEQALADTRMAEPDPGIAAVDTSPEPVDPNALRSPAEQANVEHKAAATPGKPEPVKKTPAKKAPAKAPAKAAAQKRSQPAKKSAVKKTPAKKSTGGSSSRSSRS